MEKRYEAMSPKEQQSKQKEEFFEDDGLDFSILEKRIESLTNEYKENILRAVKAFYEK
ncbi:hypothetical protein [Sulfurimonas sp. C5]|uniref:hypothetical protein n=1 Tax=Sulfurimonas sp. C5 TaxID=3036947 RepID=UPI0024566186|nr:hypothetical protein [Sulfurimonas sp. C5]